MLGDIPMQSFGLLKTNGASKQHHFLALWAHRMKSRATSAGYGVSAIAVDRAFLECYNAYNNYKRTRNR